MKEITLKLDDKTFAWLEVLVVGLAKENLDEKEFSARLSDISCKDNDDFGKGIKDLLEDIAGSLADGVKRSGSWERQCISSLTGYNGTYVPDMFDTCIKDEAKERGFESN